MNVVRARHVAVLLVAALALLWGPSPAAAHHKEGHSGGPGTHCEKPKYPPKQCQDRSAAASSSEVERGGSFTLYAQGFAPGSLTTITLHSDPVRLGATRADEFAFFSAALTIPKDAEVGDHQVVAEGLAVDGSALRLSVPITVVGSAPAAGAAPVAEAFTGGSGELVVLGVSLPRTGALIGSLGVLGGLLVVLGALLLQASRRHRPSQLA